MRFLVRRSKRKKKREGRDLYSSSPCNHHGKPQLQESGGAAAEHPYI